MQGIKEVFPYLWQLGAQVNGLYEPNELARDLIAGADAFGAGAGRLKPDERAYAAAEVTSTVRFLGETIAVLEELKEKLLESGLAGGEETQ